MKEKIGINSVVIMATSVWLLLCAILFPMFNYLAPNQIGLKHMLILGAIGIIPITINLIWGLICCALFPILDKHGWHIHRHHEVKSMERVHCNGTDFFYKCRCGQILRKEWCFAYNVMGDGGSFSKKTHVHKRGELNNEA